MKTRGPTKRILAWLLALAMTLSLVPGIALADNEGATSTWEKVELADIQETDTVAITMTKGETTWALYNGNGTTSAPTAVVVTVDGTTMTYADNESISWNIAPGSEGEGEEKVDGYVIYKAGSTDQWLYSTNANNGVRVGTNASKVWVVDETSGYLKHVGTSRYLGVYTTNPDWRAYTNTTGNTAGQTLGFWKLTSSAGGGETETQVAAPTAAPASGSAVAPGATVTLSCATADVTYHTSADQSAWTALEGNTFDIPDDAEGAYTVYVKATKDGLTDSEVLTLTYTVQESSEPTVSTIAEAKAMAVDTENITVKGVVILVDGKNVYVQDSTGGIDLYFSAAPSDVSVGDLVQATGKRAAYKGLEELSGVTDYTVISSGNTLPSNTVTIADILGDHETGALESTRVYIENAVIGAVNTSGNTTLTQGESSINIYKCPALDGVSEGDTVSLYAVVSDFNGYQLRVVSASDVTRAPGVSTIAEAKAMAVDTENITVKGVVILVDGKNVYVQDSTGGIDLYFSAAPSDVSVGDLVQATGKRAAYKGLEELSGVTDYTVISSGNTLPSNTVTIADILGDHETGALESTRVYIENAVIGAVNTSGNTTLTQGESSINIYKCPALDGVSEGDTVSLYAVISDFNGYQLRVAAASDVAKAQAKPVLTSTLSNLDKVYIYHPGSGMVLSDTVSGSKLAGVAGTVADDKLTVAEGMVELVVSYDAATGYYQFVTAEGKYLTSAATGNGLSFADAAGDYSLWTLAEDGVGYVLNNVNAKYGTNVQALEYYNGFTTYGTKTGNSAYIMQFYKSGVADELPGGGDEPTGIADGTYVIWAPAYNMALSSTTNSSNYYLGVSVSGNAEAVSGYGNTELWTVTGNGDGTYSITQNGLYLGTNASNYLTVAENPANKAWTVEETADGHYNLKCNGRYLEWYANYNDWSMYGTIGAGKEDLFALWFTPAGMVYETDSSVVEAIAAWGGGGPYDDAALSVNGDKYAVGDQLDSGAVFTAVVSGSAVKPFISTSTSYYMGGTGLGSGTDDYMQFAVSTKGWGDMELSFRLRASNTGSGEWQVQYSTDGTNFVNFTTGEYSYGYTIYSGGVLVESGTRTGDITDGIARTSLNPAGYIEFTFDVPDGAENAENLYIRLVPSTEANAKGSGAPGTGGTVRIDSVVLSGSPIVDSTITGYVSVDPDGVEEDQAPGTELTMTSATEGAVISYRFVNTETGEGEWQTYDEASKPVLPDTLPATLEVKAASEGKADSITRIFTYAAGTVAAVRMSPNGGGVYIESDPVTVTLSCETDGAVIWYRTSSDADFAEYSQPIVLEKGFGSLTVEAYAVKEGFKDSAVTKRTFTEMGSDKYEIYFGQLHSHTNISDGAGSITDAYEHASGVYNLDFLAVTDHSNSFDGSSDTLNTDATVTSPEWATAKEAAKAATTDTFLGIYGFEMTWSNGLGHINTYNTAGWQSRTQSAYTTFSTALQNYYAELKTAPESLSQFNHPGTTFGDFSDFAYYDEEIDQLITMIEVGNGEGAIGSSGYFPSYEYYTRALDKGWHVAPSNNQDNHKGNWGDSNTARTVVLATSLTEEAVYDAIRNYRVYATEDNDLSIYYTLDDNIMGSILTKSDVGDTVTLTVELGDPTDSADARIEVIVNGGLSLDSTTAACNGTVEFTVPSTYNYYYIKVTQADGDIAVTAPVWIGKVEAVGISGVTAGSELTVAGEEQSFTLELYNNESKALEVTSITYTVNGGEEHAITDITSVAKLGTASCVFGYTFAQDGVYTIKVTVKGVLNGVEKLFTHELRLTVMPAEIVSKIIVDGTHFNDYVTGYYGGNMSNMTTIASDNGVKVEVVTTQITEEMLADCSLLVISAPARKNGTANAGDYTASMFSDEFIALVKSYVEGGGNVAVCGLADYQDKSAVNGAEGHAAAQINKLLTAIGSTMSINDDEVYDAVNNGGQFYRLYPSVFNTESEWTAGIVDGQTYSQYSGCSVNVGEGTWLVRGFDTTYSVDSDKDGVGNTDEIETDDSYGYNIVTAKGEVVFLACEETEFGGTIFAAGGVFLSDFEVKAELDNIWDLPYANRTIYENILGILCATENVTPIEEIRAAEAGRVFVAEGYVTSGTADENTSFFDAIYIQDETGGITVFPYATAGLEIGTKVRVIGYTDAYQGDKEIQIISLRILNEEPHVYEPNELSTKDAMDYDANGGQLVKTTGVVSDIILSDGVVSQFKLTDSTGVAATVFIDGYITNPEGVNSIASWLKNGQTVSAVGLLYSHPEGASDVSVPVLRVRNCDEIVLVTDVADPVIPTYSISVANAENGSVAVSAVTARAGAAVTVTVTPDEGYELASLTVADAFGDEIVLTDNGDGTFTFTMPTRRVVVTAVFTMIEVEPEPEEPCDGGESCPGHHYPDVNTGKWYHE
ncbi:MAG: CehA/McbA family metallohydrolase, partial [Candidatus Enterenecus sp.]